MELTTEQWKPVWLSMKKRTLKKLAKRCNLDLGFIRAYFKECRHKQRRFMR